MLILTKEAVYGADESAPQPGPVRVLDEAAVAVETSPNRGVAALADGDIAVIGPDGVDRLPTGVEDEILLPPRPAGRSADRSHRRRARPPLPPGARVIGPADRRLRPARGPRRLVHPLGRTAGGPLPRPDLRGRVRRHPRGQHRPLRRRGEVLGAGGARPAPGRAPGGGLSRGPRAGLRQYRRRRLRQRGPGGLLAPPRQPACRPVTAGRSPSIPPTPTACWPR